MPIARREEARHGSMTALARWLALAMFVAWLTACADDAGTTATDATVADAAANDLGASNDLARDATTVDASDAGDGARDASPSVDLGLDSGRDTGTPDLGVDVPAPSDAFDWSDVPRVDLGGILVPVDPNAVPAPGSECVGDGGVRAGDSTIAPPRPIRPLSVSRATSQRPTFQWVLAEGTIGARVEVCADRCCTRVLQTMDAVGTSVRPATALPPGVVFWRMFGRTAAGVGSRPSFTWEVQIKRRDAEHDTSWGTIRDFDGDGFDDVIVFNRQSAETAPMDLLLARGSDHGLLAPVRTDIVSDSQPARESIGDFNGDGLADIIWTLIESSSSGYRYQNPVASGSSTGLHVTTRLEAAPFGVCSGLRMARATDWNGDGYSDLVVNAELSCSFEPPRAALLFIYSGSPTGLSLIPQRAIRFDGTSHDHAFDLMDSLAEVDLDGFGDIYMVSYLSAPGTLGVPPEHSIVHGSQTGFPRLEPISDPTRGSTDWRVPQTASIGDIDGDDRTDFAMQLEYHAPVLVYRSGLSLSAPSNFLEDPLGASTFGSYRRGSDVNGDGLADLVVTSPDSATETEGGFAVNQGRIYIYSGTTGGLTLNPTTIAPLRTPTERLMYVANAFALEAIGGSDVNGDGFDDVIAIDGYRHRICTRLGSTAFATGAPEQCIENVATNSSLLR